MKKILFLHGFYASGQCIPAVTLRDSFANKIQVLTPDIPQHPKKALELIRSICDKEHPVRSCPDGNGVHCLHLPAATLYHKADRRAFAGGDGVCAGGRRNPVRRPNQPG